MARKQRLINLHNGAKKAPKASELYLGEIAVQHNADEAALYTKISDDKVAKFIDETAVDSAISSAVATVNSALTEDIEALDERVDTLEAVSADTRIKAVEDVVKDLEANFDEKGAASSAETNAKAYTDEKLKGYATSANTVAAIDAVDAKFADYATSANTVAAIDAVDAKFADYATSANTVAAIDAVDAKFADYATSANTVAAIDAVDAKFADYATSADTVAADGVVFSSAKTYTDDQLKNYATSADTYNAIQEAQSALDDYATSADTVAAIAAVDAKFADYATSANTVAAIDAVDAKFADYATSANTVAAIDAIDERVDTLVGDDDNKSVRNIAAEEVAKIVASADTKFDTLKEIADWIQNDTTGAAKMANDIQALSAISADTRIKAVEDVVKDLDANFDEKGAAASAETNAKAYALQQDNILSGNVSSAIAAVDAKFADYATSANTVAADAAVFSSAKTYTDDQLKNYATSANTVAAIDAVDAKFADYATSANTYAAIEAAKSALDNYATSANTVAAIDAVDAKFADYATSANTVAAIDAVDKKYEGSLKTIDMASDDSSQSVDVTISGTTATFDFSEFIIDCGEYEGE